MRVDPWIGLDRVGYVSNLAGQLTDGGDSKDYFASASGGLQAYLPVGSNTFLTFNALPQYAWWADQKERRGLNQRFGASFLGLFNRLQAEVTFNTDERLGIFTRELQQEFIQTQDSLGAGLNVNIYRSLDLVAGFQSTDIEATDGSDAIRDQFSPLDRSETVGRAGVRLRTGRATWTVGLQESESEFEVERDRSNSGSSLFASLSLQGSRSWASLEAVALELDPEGRADLESISETTGSIDIGLASSNRRWRFNAYFRRGFTYALSPVHTHVLGTTIGARFGYGSGRSVWSSFFETGSDDFEGGPSRKDDHTAYGFDYSLPLSEKAAFRAGFTHREVESPVDPSNERSGDQFNVGIVFTPFGSLGSAPTIGASGI